MKRIFGALPVCAPVFKGARSYIPGVYMPSLSKTKNSYIQKNGIPAYTGMTGRFLDHLGRHDIYTFPGGGENPVISTGSNSPHKEMLKWPGRDSDVPYCPASRQVLSPFPPDLKSSELMMAISWSCRNCFIFWSDLTWSCLTRSWLKPSCEPISMRVTGGSE